MTLGDLIADVTSDLSQSTTPSPVEKAKWIRLINKAQRAILREPGLELVRTTLNPLTFASVADQTVYGLPASVKRVAAISERDSDRVLMEMPIDILRRTDPGLTASGTSEYYVPLGYRLVAPQPVSTGIWGVSTSASDVQTVLHAGIRSGGLETGDISTTLTGVTRVALGSLTDYVDVTSLTLNTPAVGTVSIYDAASSGNVLAQISPGRITSRYFAVQLYPTPSAAITYYVDGEIALPELIELTDVPEMPEDLHDLIPPRVRMYHYESAGNAARFAIAAQEYATILGRAKYALQAQGDPIVLGQPLRRRVSRYGPWAPAQNW